MEDSPPHVLVDLLDDLDSSKTGSSDSCSKIFVNLEIIKTEKDTNEQKTDSEDESDPNYNPPSEDLKESVIKTPKEKPNCEICGKFFQSNSTLKRHKNTHSSKKPFTCSTCSKTFNRKSSLKDHKLVHDEKKPFPCTLCSASYISKRKMELHVVRFHVVDKPFKCKDCLKTFLSQGALEAHQEKEHDGNKKLPCFPCDVCPRTFTKTPLLVKHLKEMHSRLFRCQVCKRSFSTQEEVQSHLEFIPEALACTFCPTSLATKCLLSQHVSRLHPSQYLLVVQT